MLDLNRIKERQAQTRQSSGKRWQPKDGVNRIRVFTFEHKVTSEDVEAGHFRKDKKGKVVTEVDRPLTIHFNLGADGRPVLSTPEIMKKWKALSRSKSASDQKVAKNIQPQTKFALNVVDTDEKDAEMRHWMCPKTVYNDILATIADSDYGESVLGAKGRDFVVTFNPKAEGSDKYSTKVRDADKCRKLPSDLQEAALDFYSEEGLAELGFVEAADSGDSEDEAEESEEDADEKDEADEKEESEDEDDDSKDDEEESDEDDEKEKDSDDEEISDEDLEDDDEDEKPKKGKDKKKGKKK